MLQLGQKKVYPGPGLRTATASLLITVSINGCYLYLTISINGCQILGEQTIEARGRV
jgi:hypothetical protein